MSDISAAPGHRTASAHVASVALTTSPPHVPGPPPHFHRSESEFFFVVDGTLDVMVDGDDLLVTDQSNSVIWRILLR